jgi:ATP-dependent Clp protease adapter protein ClpS
MPDFPDIEHDSDVLTESETRLEKPPLFKVILHNDDFTTMEFVVFVLKHVFNALERRSLFDYAQSSQRRHRHRGRLPV